MAKEHVEYSMAIHVFSDTNVCLCCTLLCDIDNNWVSIVTHLSLDLVGGMGTGEADPSQT